LLKALSSKFVEVSCDDIGTHPMQRLVEMINMAEEREVIYQSIVNSVVQMAFHPKGNYVFLLVLSTVKIERLN
jgi:hypothetical protein